MKAMALLAAVPVVLAQTPGPAPRVLLNLARPLTPAEIATVLTGSHEGNTGTTERKPI
jgi:hypothetical protein